MSRLLDIIDTYKDRHGRPSDASIARAIGVAPQTISSWRNRGIKDLPSRDTLEQLAAFVGLPYSAIRDAALVDTRYMPDDEYEPPVWPPLERRGRRGA